MPVGGSNQARVRDYNLRLILSLIMRSGSLSKAEIARMTGLSAQAITIIMRELESEDFLLRGPPQRGRVGQPSIPMALNPDGAFALGLKIGRRSNDVVLVDLAGNVRRQARRVHPYPDLDDTLAFAAEATADLTADLSPESRQRVVGLGVATPYEIWNWTEVIGVEHGTLDGWRGIDIGDALAGRLGVKVITNNDCTAACSAEHVYGAGTAFDDFMYIFIGSFIGGGIVMNGALYSGPSRNAGALGPLPVLSDDGKRGPILGYASLYVLEDMLVADGHDPSSVWLSPTEWDDFGETLNRWIVTTAKLIAQAIVSICSTIDFPAVVIDGAFPEEVRRRLVDAIDAALEQEDIRGLTRPEILAGQVGAGARAIGGASLPLVADYLLDRNVLTLRR